MTTNANSNLNDVARPLTDNSLLDRIALVCQQQEESPSNASEVHDREDDANLPTGQKTLPVTSAKLSRQFFSIGNDESHLNPSPSVKKSSYNPNHRKSFHKLRKRKSSTNSRKNQLLSLSPTTSRTDVVYKTRYLPDYNQTVKYMYKKTRPSRSVPSHIVKSRSKSTDRKYAARTNNARKMYDTKNCPVAQTSSQATTLCPNSSTQDEKLPNSYQNQADLISFPMEEDSFAKHPSLSQITQSTTKLLNSNSYTISTNPQVFVKEPSLSTKTIFSPLLPSNNPDQTNLSKENQIIITNTKSFFHNDECLGCLQYHKEMQHYEQQLNSKNEEIRVQKTQLANLLNFREERKYWQDKCEQLQEQRTTQRENQFEFNARHLEASKHIPTVDGSNYQSSSGSNRVRFENEPQYYYEDESQQRDNYNTVASKIHYYNEVASKSSSSAESNQNLANPLLERHSSMINYLEKRNLKRGIAGDKKVAQTQEEINSLTKPNMPSNKFKYPIQDEFQKRLSVSWSNNSLDYWTNSSNSQLRNQVAALRTALGARQSLLNEMRNRISKAHEILNHKHGSTAFEPNVTLSDLQLIVKTYQKFVRWLNKFIIDGVHDIQRFERRYLFNNQQKIRYYYEGTMLIEPANKNNHGDNQEVEGIFIPLDLGHYSEEKLPAATEEAFPQPRRDVCKISRSTSTFDLILRKDTGTNVELEESTAPGPQETSIELTITNESSSKNSLRKRKSSTYKEITKNHNSDLRIYTFHSTASLENIEKANQSEPLETENSFPGKHSFHDLSAPIIMSPEFLPSSTENPKNDAAYDENNNRTDSESNLVTKEIYRRPHNLVEQESKDSLQNHEFFVGKDKKFPKNFNFIEEQSSSLKSIRSGPPSLLSVAIASTNTDKFSTSAIEIEPNTCDDGVETSTNPFINIESIHEKICEFRDVVKKFSEESLKIAKGVQSHVRINEGDKESQLVKSVDTCQLVIEKEFYSCKEFPQEICSTDLPKLTTDEGFEDKSSIAPEILQVCPIVSPIVKEVLDVDDSATEYDSSVLSEISPSSSIDSIFNSNVENYESGKSGLNFADTILQTPQELPGEKCAPHGSTSNSIKVSTSISNTIGKEINGGASERILKTDDFYSINLENDFTTILKKSAAPLIKNQNSQTTIIAANNPNSCFQNESASAPRIPFQKRTREREAEMSLDKEENESVPIRLDENNTAPRAPSIPFVFVGKQESPAQLSAPINIVNKDLEKSTPDAFAKLEGKQLQRAANFMDAQEFTQKFKSMVQEECSKKTMVDCNNNPLPQFGVQDLLNKFEKNLFRTENKENSNEVRPEENNEQPKSPRHSKIPVLSPRKEKSSAPPPVPPRRPDKISGNPTTPRSVSPTSPRYNSKLENSSVNPNFISNKTPVPGQKRTFTKAASFGSPQTSPRIPQTQKRQNSNLEGKTKNLRTSPRFGNTEKLVPKLDGGKQRSQYNTPLQSPSISPRSNNPNRPTINQNQESSSPTSLPKVGSYSTEYKSAYGAKRCGWNSES